jgi:glycosyltransferase involved in cell wall biosynthesis
VAATNGGLLVTPDHPEDLARGLRCLLENPAHREQLGQMGKESVHQSFHADQMARDTLAVYARYLPGSAKGA